MSACRKNPPYGSATPSELEGLSAPSGATAQSDEAPSRPGSAILDSPGPELGLDLAPGPALALTPLLSIEEIFKQFIQTYMDTVWNQT